MRNLLILLFALVMSHPVIAQAQSDVSIKLDDIDVKVTEKDGVKFTVKVKATGLADNQTVNVYYYLQGDKSGNNGKESAPLKAKLEGNVYTFTVSDLQPEKDNECTAVIFAGLGTFETGEFTKYDEYYKKFSTQPATEVTITFPEGSHYSEEQNDKKYAQIVVKPEVDVQNVGSDYPTLYYNVYLGDKQVRKEVAVPWFGNPKYEFTITDLEFSREYRVEVFAAIVPYGETLNEYHYRYESIWFTETTPNDPNAPSVSIELGKIDYNVDEKEGVKFTVEVNATGLADDQTVYVYYYVQGDQSGKNGTAEKPEKVKLDGKVCTFTLSELKPDDNNKDNKYTAVIFAGVGEFDKPGFIQSKEESVTFSTEPAKTEVTISFPEGSYYSKVQDENHAKIVVNPVVVFDMTDEIRDNKLYLYYDLYLDNELKEKEVPLHQGENYTYDCEIEGLLFSREYTVEVYAKVIDLIDKNLVHYESDPHASFTITTVNNNGVTTLLIETDGNSDVRYFDLQGNELKNPSKGRVYIKVEGNKAVKVVK